MIPYGKQWLDEDDVAAVAATLRSDFLTTGPKVAEFEAAMAARTGAREAVAVNSGTAALHAALFAAGVGPGDEVIVAAMTFLASSNAAVFLGATPVFADVDPATLLLDPARAAALVTPRTKAIVAVDFAGQPCDYPALSELARRHGLVLVADAAHSLGGALDGRPVGSLADLTTLSFHPVKHITTGEGGMIVTDDPARARAMRSFRSHGVDADVTKRSQSGAHFYDMQVLGFNYRLTDLACALGLSQLRRLPEFLARRREIAARYDRAFAGLSGLRLLITRPGALHAYHLYPVMLELERLDCDRDRIYAELRQEGVGVNVHYRPPHLHGFYAQRFGYGPGLCPVAEDAYLRLLSLPMFPRLTDGEVEEVIATVGRVLARHQR